MAHTYMAAVVTQSIVHRMHGAPHASGLVSHGSQLYPSLDTLVVVMSLRPLSFDC